MTNKILRKLTLSAVTLGVAAVSATTSTFAWFTTNSEVTASTVSGTVKAVNSNMLLSVYKSSAWEDPKKSVTLPTGSVNLAPVQVTSTVSGGTTTYGFTKAGETKGEFTTAANDNTDYIHYQLVFHMSDLANGEGLRNVLTANFNGFAGGIGTQYLLADASTDASGAKAGDTISVDLLNVLSVRVESSIITSDKLSEYSITDTVSYTASNIKSNDTKFYRYNGEKDTVKVSDNDKKADALTYYNNVHQKSLNRESINPTYENTYLSNTDNSTDTTKTGITLFEITGTSKAYVKTDIYLYIDGWDKQCFNAVGGLNITAGSIEFNLKPASTE